MRLLATTLILAAALSSFACNRKDDDKLSDDEVAVADGKRKASPAADTRCTSPSVHEAVKRELFRRAAEVRAANAENYAKIAGYAVLTVDNAAPTAPATASEAIECRGRATLRLPPNLAVAGGRTSLTGTIGYSVGRASGGAPPVVTLVDDQAITIPLATLTQGRRASAPAPAPVPAREPSPAPASSTDPIAPPAPREPPPPRIAPEPPRPVAQPSFDCRRARSRSEIAVCASPSLAALDRTMAAQYQSAASAADRGQAALLRQTRDRFLGFRERCGNDGCIANTYRGRMREIDDIMAGRWQPTR